MADSAIGIILHGVTGRMGDVAHRAVRRINEEGGVKAETATFALEPIGLGRSASKLKAYAADTGLKCACESLEEALDIARRVNPELQIYHNAVTTGVRRDVMLYVLPSLDPSTTAVFCEKPLAADYAEGREIVEMLERGRFLHGVVHDLLETPGVRKALQLLPRIKPIHGHMLFGYEVGPGFDAKPEFRGQRPDFNWTLAEAGGGARLLDPGECRYLPALRRHLFGFDGEDFACVAAPGVRRTISCTG